MAPKSKIGQRFCWQDSSQDGSFVLSKDYLQDSGAERLSTAARTALALTDICCARGVGMVYLFLSHKPWLEYSSRARNEIRQIPEVLFVPESWTEAEQRDWQTRGWRWQFSRICVRNGWLPDHTPVLPIRLQIDTEQTHRPRFEALTEAPVLIYCTPMIHVALTADIEAEAELWAATRKRKTWIYEVNGDDDVERWRKMHKWKVDGVDTLISRLGQYYWRGANEGSQLTKWYGTLTALLATFRSRADLLDE